MHPRMHMCMRVHSAWAYVDEVVYINHVVDQYNYFIDMSDYYKKNAKANDPIN